MADIGDLLENMNSQNAQLNKWFEDPSDLIQAFELSLRAKQIMIHRNPKTGKEEYLIEDIKGDKPKMNEIGIREVISFINTSLLNRNITLSEITKDETYRDVRSVVFRFHELVIQNYERWGLETNYINTLCLNVENICWFAFNRPVEGKNKRFIRGILQLQEIIHRNEEVGDGNKKKGIELPFFSNSDKVERGRTL